VSFIPEMQGLYAMIKKCNTMQIKKENATYNRIKDKNYIIISIDEE
jgi:hypothetical protein